MNKIEAHPNHKEILQLITDNRMSTEQAARELEVDPGQLRRYIKDTAEATELDTLNEYTAGIQVMIRMLGSMLDTIKDNPVESEMVKMVTSMTRECRGLIRDLADLQGKMGKVAGIEANPAEAKYNDLVSFLMVNLCGECRMLVGRSLAERKIITADYKVSDK